MTDGYYQQAQTIYASAPEGLLQLGSQYAEYISRLPEEDQLSQDLVLAWNGLSARSTELATYLSSFKTSLEELQLDVQGQGRTLTSEGVIMDSILRARQVEDHASLARLLDEMEEKLLATKAAHQKVVDAVAAARTVLDEDSEETLEY